MGEYGEALINAGKFDEATKVRDRLAKLAPRFFWTHYLNALLFNRAGRLDEAHAQAMTVLKTSPDHVGSLLVAASTEMRRGELELAQQRLTNLVRKDPELLPALRMLAQAEVRLGRGADAATLVRRGLTLSPKDAELLMLRAQLEAAAGRSNEAAATYAEVAAQHPDEPDVLISLAQARVAAGDQAGARQLLDRLPAMVADGKQGARVVQLALGMRETDRARRIADQILARFPKDEQARLAVAAVKSALGDSEGAWKTTLAVLDDSPGDSGALVALAAMSRTPAQRNELLARHEKALTTGSGGPSQAVDYAELLRFEGNRAKTTPLSVLDRAVQRFPDSVQARRALVSELLRSGDMARALSVAEAGAAVANAPPQARELLGATYLRGGKLDQAAEVYRKLGTEFPQRADWQMAAAQALQSSGQSGKAVSILRTLINNVPNEAEAYVRLAELVAPTNLDEALSVARQMSNREALKLPAMILEGDVLTIAKRYDDAIAQFQKAAKAGALPIAQLRLIGVMDRAGRRAAGDENLAQALQRYPEHPAVLAFAAQRALSNGDAAKAATWWAKVVERDPKNAIALNDLAWSQVLAGQPQALGNALKAVALLPDNPVALDTLGMAQHLSGKNDEALATLRKAITIEPAMQGPRLHLAQVLLAKGDRAGAQAAVNELKPDKMSDGEKAALQKLNTKLGT